MMLSSEHIGAIRKLLSLQKRKQIRQLLLDAGANAERILSIPVISDMKSPSYKSVEDILSLGFDTLYSDFLRADADRIVLKLLLLLKQHGNDISNINDRLRRDGIDTGREDTVEQNKREESSSNDSPYTSIDIIHAQDVIIKPRALSICKKIWHDPVWSAVIAAIIVAILAWLFHRTYVNQTTPSLEHISSYSITPSNTITNKPPAPKVTTDKKKDFSRIPNEIAKGSNISLLITELQRKGLYNDLEAAESFLAAQTANSVIAALERYHKVIRRLSSGAYAQLDRSLLESAKSDEEGKHLDDAAAKYRALFSDALVQYRHYQEEANR